MATVLNIGVKREHVESRARVLTQAGHLVKNAFSIAELEQYLRDGDAEVLVLGHNLPAPEKRRILEYAKHASTKYRIVEVFMLVPELLAADAHVSWDECADTLPEAVEMALGLRKTRSVSTGQAS